MESLGKCGRNSNVRHPGEGRGPRPAQAVDWVEGVDTGLRRHDEKFASFRDWQSFRRKGFSLIEVLVATAILATGLIAASRAALVATNDQGILRDRTLARWVAHNTLAEIRLRPQQAQAGSAFTQQALQSGIEFTATARVTATPSPIFSRVEVSVARAVGDGQTLATAVGFSARP